MKEGFHSCEVAMILNLRFYETTADFFFGCKYVGAKMRQNYGSEK